MYLKWLTGSNELCQSQISKMGSDLQDEEREISTTENASHLDVSRKNLKEFPTYLYSKCLYVKVRYNKLLTRFEAYY
jgi:hypothetical protein